ncbi:SDR family NAD(P)-dependent oxidoreductase [Spirosoma linguale]|uniref:Short-chain dehydrogenase/reductase SDR n=1 Tax=Spirosoma linguale (strain ATCC 33905 / DSM 74 / LMG 10896 / Claus 1) TaxID=504472 RepID=D2QUC0_SPILD|nr:short-chain dehydrogenase/reductase SDR [Spirosoma linguale DSM 74]
MTLSTREQQRLFKNYGTWAIVTGATSGIGLELVTQLAEAGFSLILNARNEAALTQLAAKLQNQHPIQVRTVAADISDPATIQRLLDITADLPIGLLIASAGFGTSGPLIDGTLADELAMVRVNCTSLLAVTYHFAQRFSEQGRGGIVLLSSLVAFQGVPYSANYAATKAYVQSLAEGLARELQPSGVSVLAAAPGPVKSGFGDRANMRMNMALTPQQVGIPILRALGRQTTVLPGLLTKLLTYSLRTVPRWAKIRIMEQVMGGMTQHQRTSV